MGAPAAQSDQLSLADARPYTEEDAARERERLRDHNPPSFGGGPTFTPPGYDIDPPVTTPPRPGKPPTGWVPAPTPPPYVKEAPPVIQPPPPPDPVVPDPNPYEGVDYGVGSKAVYDATRMAAKEATYTPETLRSLGASTTVTDPVTGEETVVPGQGLQEYMNPYTQSVIDPVQRDIERQRDMAMDTIGAKASSAGAFGGSRQALLEGETGRHYGEVAADTSSRLRDQAYREAMDSARYDITGGMQGSRQRLQAAGALGDLGLAGQGAALTSANAAAQMGREQQAIQQATIDADRARWNEPYERIRQDLAMRQGILEGFPVGTTQTQSYPQQPWWQQAGQGLLGAASIYAGLRR